MQPTCTRAASGLLGLTPSRVTSVGAKPPESPLPVPPKQTARVRYCHCSYRGSRHSVAHWQKKNGVVVASIVMSKAYGLYLGCSRAPIKRRIGSWIQTSHRRHGVEPNGSVPLWKRRGVACLAPDREGHEGLGRCVPWDNTGPVTRECSVQVQ